MAKNNEGEAQQGGFFGRIFGNKGKSPIKAKMGEQNAFVYDEKLKRWVIPGEKIEESALPSAPPLMSRAASAASMSESEGPDGHRRTGSTDSSKRAGAAARYANPGLLATSRTASEQSMSAASIIPSPAKPPLVPSTKASVFVPGKAEGAAAASGPRFFVPGGTSSSQGASSRFAGFSSKAKQAPVEEATAEQPAPEEALLSPSKRAKTGGFGQQGAAESMESEVTLAKGLGAQTETTGFSQEPFLGGNIQQAAPVPLTSSAAAEESVGENILANDVGISDSAITSPGPKELGNASWGLGAGNAADQEGAGIDPEGADGGDVNQSVQYGSDFGLGQGEGSYVQPPDQEYFGADTAAAAQLDGSSAPAAAEAEGGAGEAAQPSWEEVQQWADYYRQEGYSEEDVQAWIASNYPQFAQQPAFQDPSQRPQAADEAAGTENAQEQLPANEQQYEHNSMAAAQQGTPVNASTTEDASEQPQSSFKPAAEGVQQETAYQARSRLQSEAYSDMAECGSSRGHLDDLTSAGTGGGREALQAQSLTRHGRLASESSASGKLSGPLPWDVLDEHSDEENSTAGTPRFELAFSNGEVGNAARPALAGAAFAEAAEQAGNKLSGWVTGLVRSGVQSHLAANARFPRAPLDVRNAPSSPSASIRSGTTSIRAQQGTPTSIKSVDRHTGDAGSLPPSAKAARYARGAFDNESVLSEPIIEEDADHGSHDHHSHSEPPAIVGTAGAAQANSQGQDTSADAWAGANLNNHTAERDGWDFDASTLDDLPPASQPPGELPSEEQLLSAAEGANLQDAAVENKQAQDSLGRLPHTWAGDLQQPPAAQADFAFDRSDPIPTAVSGTGDALSGVGTNGGGSLMGESPQAGWEGESELGFPLDDVPKDVAEPSGSGTALDLPEAAALTPLKVPPLSPLRTVSGSGASGRPTSAAAAAVKEAFAHGDEAAQLAALQERLEEVVAQHQHASDECETLRDQNGALELELADLKTQLDADVAEARQAQDALAAKAHLEEQLEELWQELEQLRVKNDALKADNATLLAERADDGAAAAHSNGDLKPRAAGDGADAPAAAAAAELEAASQRIAELEAELEQAGDAAEVARLEAQVMELMAESEALAEEALTKDEEIEALEGRLEAADKALAAAQQARAPHYKGGSEELERLRRESAAANAEIVSLGDALDATSQETASLRQGLAASDAELESLRAELAAKADDVQLLEDLQLQVAARESEIARLQGEVSSKDAEMARISKEVAAKEATEKKLRLALKHAKEAAAKERTEVAAQLQAAQQAASDAQAEARNLAEQLSQLQVDKSSAQQLCQKAEAEVKTLKENQALDFERIGLLSDENAALQEKIDELEAEGASRPSEETAAEVARLSDELAAAEARAKTLAQEKETFGKRGAKLQAKLNRLQTESQEKQAQLAKELEEARAGAAAAEKQAAEAEAARAALAEAVQQEKARVSQGEQGLKAEASALAAQVAELQAAVGAEAESRKEAEQQLAQAAQEAAHAAAAKHALSEELAAEKNKVAELEEEATALFDKVSAAEEEAGAAEARAHALAEQLKAAHASLQDATEPRNSGGSEAEELAQALAASAEQEKEFGDLLACLGQESAKVAALQELLAQRGIDPSGVLAQVEADYGFGDELGGDEEGEEDEPEGEQMPEPEAPTEAEPEHGDPLAQAGPGAAEDAPADQDWPGLSADVMAKGTPQEDLPSVAQHAHQSSIEGLPEGELLSPDKGLPRLHEAVKSEITAGINFGSAQPSAAAGGQEIDFDGWGADADGDWGFN